MTLRAKSLGKLLNHLAALLCATSNHKKRDCRKQAHSKVFADAHNEKIDSKSRFIKSDWVLTKTQKNSQSAINFEHNFIA